jgi:hypothetical protein
VISVATINGVATFSALNLDKAGDGYTLVATTTGLTQIESTAFNINFGQPTRVVIDTHPGNGMAGEPLTPAIVARIEDSVGNLVEDSTAEVTISIAQQCRRQHAHRHADRQRGQRHRHLQCNVVLDKVGLGYTLQAASFALESVSPTRSTSATMSRRGSPSRPSHRRQSHRARSSRQRYRPG